MCYFNSKFKSQQNLLALIQPFLGGGSREGAVSPPPASPQPPNSFGGIGQFVQLFQNVQHPQQNGEASEGQRVQQAATMAQVAEDGRIGRKRTNLEHSVDLQQFPGSRRVGHSLANSGDDRRRQRRRNKRIFELKPFLRLWIRPTASETETAGETETTAAGSVQPLRGHRSEGV